MTALAKLVAPLRAPLRRVNQSLDAAAHDIRPVVVGPDADQRLDPVQQPQVVGGEPVADSAGLPSQHVAARQRKTRGPRRVLIRVGSRRPSEPQLQRDRDDGLQRIK